MLFHNPHLLRTIQSEQLSSFRCSTLCATLRSHPPVASTATIPKIAQPAMLTFGTDDHMEFVSIRTITVIFIGSIIHHLRSCVNPFWKRCKRPSFSLDQNRQAFELQGCWTSIIFIQLPPSYETLHSLSCECKSSWSPPAPLVYAAATVGELLPLAWWNNMIGSTSGGFFLQAIHLRLCRATSPTPWSRPSNVRWTWFFFHKTTVQCPETCHKLLLLISIWYAHWNESNVSLRRLNSGYLVWCSPLKHMRRHAKKMMSWLTLPTLQEETAKTPDVGITASTPWRAGTCFSDLSSPLPKPSIAPTQGINYDCTTANRASSSSTNLRWTNLEICLDNCRKLVRTWDLYILCVCAYIYYLLLCIYINSIYFDFTIPWYLEKTACFLPSPFVFLTIVMASTGTYWNPGMLSSAHHLPAVFPPWFFHWKYSDCLANGLRTSKLQHVTWIIRLFPGDYEVKGWLRSWWKKKTHCIRFFLTISLACGPHPKNDWGFLSVRKATGFESQSNGPFSFVQGPLCSRRKYCRWHVRIWQEKKQFKLIFQSGSVTFAVYIL